MTSAACSARVISFVAWRGMFQPYFTLPSLYFFLISLTNHVSIQKPHGPRRDEEPWLRRGKQAGHAISRRCCCRSHKDDIWNWRRSCRTGRCWWWEIEAGLRTEVASSPGICGTWRFTTSCLRHRQAGLARSSLVWLHQKRKA